MHGMEIREEDMVNLEEMMLLLEQTDFSRGFYEFL